MLSSACSRSRSPWRESPACNAGEGTLSVEDGHGKVTLQARGGVIGRLDRGFVTIHDLSPEDAFEPWVVGDDQPVRFVGESGIRYGGVGLRFRLVGGSYRIVIEGRGIDLSVVAKGSGSIVALSRQSIPACTRSTATTAAAPARAASRCPRSRSASSSAAERGEKSLVGPAAD